MQLNTMNCSGRSNFNGHDPDLADEMSHDDHSDDEMNDCDSIENNHITEMGSRLNTSISSNGTSTNSDMNGHDHANDIVINHHRTFPSSHPLNALGSFMGIGNLHGIPNLQHNDVLEKLKMQVRDIKVGLMDQEYVAAHAAAFGSNVVPTPVNTAFTLPPTTMASYSHAAHNLTAQADNSLSSNLNPNSSQPSARPSLPNGSHNNFSFASPPAPSTKDGNPTSSSSTSSETSNSSQQNSWSFEEQYKQVRQLYEINDDPQRKEFLDELFAFMQKRGSPINRLPIMAKSVLDLYELYNLVIARGGLVEVINKKLWQEIIKGLHLPSSITSAAFTLRTQYMKYLYPYECKKKNFSTPAQLQSAIDGNRREGRRSSYGQYEAVHSQMQMSQINHQALPSGLQQVSPLALVTHAANNQQAQAAAAAVAAHHRLMAPSFGQMQNVVTQEIEQRMIEYLKLIQVKKEQSEMGSSAGTMSLSPQQRQQQQRQRSQSPEISTREALNALEMSRVALWQMYNNNTSPPASVNTSPHAGGTINNGRSLECVNESQRTDVLNLSESPLNFNTIKREREREPSPEVHEHSDFLHQPPPSKRSGFPASFYLPSSISGIAAAAAAASSASCNYKDDIQASDNEADNDKHNTTAAIHHVSTNSVTNDKSDDSAIENSPTTSGASAGNGQISPVSHLPKQTYAQNNTTNTNTIVPKSAENIELRNSGSLDQFDALTLLSGMQFRVTRNGTNSNGEQELIVNLEINDVKYSGVLVANTSSGSSSAEATTLKKTQPTTSGSNISNYINNSNNEKISTHCTSYDSGSHNHTLNSSNNEHVNDLTITEDLTDDESDTETLSSKSPATHLNIATNPNDSNSSKDSPKNVLATS